MNELSIWLALEDFVPVFLSIAGLWCVVQMVGRVDAENGRLTLLGLLLVGMGGLFKASWKLIFVTTGRDIVFLDNSLFIFLALGFACLSWGLWAGQQRLRGLPVSERVWLRPFLIYIPVALLALFLSRDGSRTWVFVLLGLTTLKNSIFLINLTRQAIWQRQRLEALFFALSFVLIFVLSGLARLEQTPAIQWIDQGVNTVSQALFLYAAYQVAQQAQHWRQGATAVVN